MIVENFDLSNAYKFCDYLISHKANNNKDAIYIKSFAYYVAQCKNYNRNKLVIGMTTEQFEHLLLLLNNFDKNVMAEVSERVQGDWSKVLSELGVAK
ncbi:hypothetical protein DSM106972_025560 [Dulcicalothrix desertica PCC 7102]|uniref:Uncharacterized protein n=1 Tax=Dulcicalothrix desertica PCC 7102 TaxID=232991 RepID=A0A3S1CRV6_9CYAN|nr:hypothetical protein [Dulcicalothrix desertica]RUT07295.1 hypothetical protein DSM106972_025560 [Dulcicalothrix desertica PCC 7102]TWH55505.1 hypothetical protein CAL7102_03649 [Dulcicalothrix desertica PCC 7102]